MAVIRESVVGGGKVLVRLCLWLLRARGGIFSLVSRISAVVMSFVGVLLCAVALGGLVGAYACGSTQPIKYTKPTYPTYPTTTKPTYPTTTKPTYPTTTKPTPTSPSVTLEKTGPATGLPGGQGTYTITVTNSGNGAATSQVITDSLPSGETYVSSTDPYNPSSSGVCSDSGQTVSCPIGTLAAGATESVSVTVSYASGTGGQTLTDCATVTDWAQHCASTKITPPTTPNTPPPAISIGVTKANDAAGSGFGQSEIAPAPFTAVPFQVVVTNTSSVPVTITSLTDSWPGQAAFAVPCAASVVGETLAAGQSATCDFTLPGYAPAAGTSLTDTVVTTGCESTDASNCASQSATSTVISPPPVSSLPLPPAPTPVTIGVTKTNDANGLGYAVSESSTGAGETVPFRVSVTNTSSVSVTITSVTDSWPGQAPFSPLCAQEFAGITLVSGASATCDFTVDGYAPDAGGSLTDTVSVSACQITDASSCATQEASSTVTTPANPPATAASTPQPITGEVTTSQETQPPAATAAEVAPAPATAASSGSLAFTGSPAHLQLLLEIGFSMASLGFFLIWFTRPRRPAASPR